MRQLFSSKLKMILNSQEGFSIVGVLTASTIGFVVLMGIVESMGHISQSVRKGNQSLSILELRKDIMRIAMQNTGHTSDASSCENTLKGVKTNGHSADTDSNIHTYTFPESAFLKKAGPSPGPDSPYKVYKKDGTGDSDIYFGSLVIQEMRFEKDTPDPPPATNVIATTGRLRISFLDKNRSYIQFEDLTPLIVEDIQYDTDNETILSCNFKLDARTVVDCYQVKQNGTTLVGCSSTQAIPNVQTTAYGYNIAGSSSSGAYNSFFGYQTAKNNTSGANNSYFGHSAGKMIESGSNNSFFGYQAGFGFQTGAITATAEKNTFIGSWAGYKNITGNESVFVGYQAGYESAGDNNTFVGASAGYNSATGNNNTFIGKSAGYNNISNSNSFFGYNAGYTNTSGSLNTFVGAYSGYNNTTAKFNNFFGYNAGYNNKTGSNNIFLGNEAGFNNETGHDNLFIGYRAGKANESNRNIFLGSYAGSKNHLGSDNIFLGHISGSRNISGQYNISIGAYSNTHNETGSHNTFVGYGSGSRGKNDSYNTIIGRGAGIATRGNNNTYLGHQAGHWIGGLKTGPANKRSHNNIMIGFETSFGNYPHGGCADPCPNNGIGSDNIFIGHRIKTRFHDKEIRIGNAIHEKVIIASRHPDGTLNKLNLLEIGDLVSIEKDLTSATHTIKIGDNAFTDVEIGSYNLKTMSDTVTTLDNTVTTLGNTVTTLGNTVRALSSSKTLKKNIMPWTDYEMALKDIVETPLSYYEYKDSHPNHTRRGFIAEDLPAHMQLPPEEGSALVKPDWATIWGSFWAGIKALAIKFDSLKSEMSEKWAELAESMSDLKTSFSALKSEMTQTVSELKAENAELRKELTEMKKEMADMKAMMKNN